MAINIYKAYSAIRCIGFEPDAKDFSFDDCFCGFHQKQKFYLKRKSLLIKFDWSVVYLLKDHGSYSANTEDDSIGLLFYLFAQKECDKAMKENYQLKGRRFSEFYKSCLQLEQDYEDMLPSMIREHLITKLEEFREFLPELYHKLEFEDFK